MSLFIKYKFKATIIIDKKANFEMGILMLELPNQVNY